MELDIEGLWLYWQKLLSTDRSDRVALERQTHRGENDLNLLFDMAYRQDPEFMGLMVELLRVAPNDDARQWLGTGPLEDFLAAANEQTRRDVLALAEKDRFLAIALGDYS